MTLFDRLVRSLGSSHNEAVRDESHFNPVDHSFREAAVLIAVTDAAEPGVILTQRPLWLRSHAGQVAFPGGKIDECDENAVAAALREAEEEIGLATSAAKVFGVADLYKTGSGYAITPVIAKIAADLPLVANPQEVEDWFEVPLDFLLDPKNLKLLNGDWQGQSRDYYEIIWQDRRIWGVTAGIIANLQRRLA